jgi:hypothetical protein
VWTCSMVMAAGAVASAVSVVSAPAAAIASGLVALAMAGEIAAEGMTGAADWCNHKKKTTITMAGGTKWGSGLVATGSMVASNCTNSMEVAWLQESMSTSYKDQCQYAWIWHHWCKTQGKTNSGQRRMCHEING